MLSEDYSNSEIYKKCMNEVKTINVNTSTLDSFIKKNDIKNIDIYISDTEGFDWIIFNQLDLNIFNPKIICMETHTLGEDQNNLIDEKLIKNGYNIIKKEWDTLAIKK